MRTGLNRVPSLSGTLLRKYLLAITLFLAACLPPVTRKTTSGQQGTVHAPVVWITDSVRAKLKRQWNDSDPNQTERAYCGIVEEKEYSPGTPEYNLVAILPSPTVHSDPSRVVFFCPPDIGIKNLLVRFHFTELHIHTPTTCSDNECRMGGKQAWECYPSNTDYADLLNHSFKLAFIQCSAEAIVPYFERAYWIE
jgi:hypothetical protein